MRSPQREALPTWLAAEKLLARYLMTTRCTMSKWSCPSCGGSVSSYDVSCECGFTRAELEPSPLSEGVASRRPFAPPFPWLGRALVILRVCAFLGLAYGALTVLTDVYHAYTVPLSARDGAVAALLWHALLTAAGALISFVLTLGLVDAGNMLRAIHRRVGALDERDRAGL